MVQARYSNLWGDRRFSPETEYGVCTEAQVQENSSLITFRITQASPADSCFSLHRKLP